MPFKAFERQKQLSCESNISYARVSLDSNDKCFCFSLLKLRNSSFAQLKHEHALRVRNDPAKHVAIIYTT